MKSFDKNRLFLWHYSFAILFLFLAVYIQKSIGYENPNEMLKKTFYLYFMVIIGAPVIETVLIQLVPFKILQLLKIKNYFIILFLLTLLFSVLHKRFYDNIIIFLMSTVSCGVIINYFLQVKKRENTKRAVLKTIIFHSLFNTSIIILDIIYNKFLCT